MRMSDLRKICPKASTKTWHRHANGGGWVENTARVSKRSFVGPNAIVKDRAYVQGQARIEGNARVSRQAYIDGHTLVAGNARVSDNARVGGISTVGDNARVVGDAVICGDSHVGDRALVTGYTQVINSTVDGSTYAKDGVIKDARVSRGRIEESPIQIDMEPFGVTGVPGQWIRIGCSEGTIAWWKKNGLRIAYNNCLTAANVLKYKKIIELFDAIEPKRIRKNAKAVVSRMRNAAKKSS